MSRLAHFQSLHTYEQWASAKTLAALRSAESTDADRDAFKRALGIFCHIQSARHEWLFRLGHRQRRPWVMFPEWTTDQAQADAARLDQEWSAYLAALTEPALDQEVHYHSNEGKPFTSFRRDILTHVYNHSTYHRGQIAILVKFAGGTPPDTTDYIVTARRQG